MQRVDDGRREMTEALRLSCFVTDDIRQLLDAIERFDEAGLTHEDRCRRGVGAARASARMICLKSGLRSLTAYAPVTRSASIAR